MRLAGVHVICIFLLALVNTSFNNAEISERTIFDHGINEELVIQTDLDESRVLGSYHDRYYYYKSRKACKRPYHKRNKSRKGYLPKSQRRSRSRRRRGCIKLGPMKYGVPLGFLMLPIGLPLAILPGFPAIAAPDLDCRCNGREYNNESDGSRLLSLIEKSKYFGDRSLQMEDDNESFYATKNSSFANDDAFNLDDVVASELTDVYCTCHCYCDSFGYVPVFRNETSGEWTDDGSGIAPELIHPEEGTCGCVEAGDYSDSTSMSGGDGSEDGRDTNTLAPTTSLVPTQSSSPSVSPSDGVDSTKSLAPSVSMFPSISLDPTESIAPSVSVSPSISFNPTESLAPSISMSPTTSPNPTESPEPSISLIPSTSQMPSNPLLQRNSDGPTISRAPTLKSKCRYSNDLDGKSKPAEDEGYGNSTIYTINCSKAGTVDFFDPFNPF